MMSAVWEALKRRWFLIPFAVLGCLAFLWWFSASYISIGGSVTSHGPDTQPKIALTFDDGPSAGYTPKILQILDRYQAKGTFFVTGDNVEKHPEIARQIVAQGHQIANHSQSHSKSLRYRLPHQIVSDYHKAEKAIREATGLEPRFYRAPHGRLSPWMRWSLRNQGLTLTGWDNSPRDWENPGVEELVNRVISEAHPGSIVLLHDGHGLDETPDRSQLVQALPMIIEQLQAQGYQLVTVAELLEKEPYF